MLLTSSRDNGKKYKPVCTSIARCWSSMRIARTFILITMLKAAIWTLLTFSFHNKIKTDTSQKLFPSIHVMSEVARFTTWARSGVYKFETKFLTISITMPLSFPGDIVSPILRVRNSVTTPFCTFTRIIFLGC